MAAALRVAVAGRTEAAVTERIRSAGWGDGKESRMAVDLAELMTEDRPRNELAFVPDYPIQYLILA
jgi:hypothetical protein